MLRAMARPMEPRPIQPIRRDFSRDDIPTETRTYRMPGENVVAVWKGWFTYLNTRMRMSHPDLIGQLEGLELSTSNVGCKKRGFGDSQNDRDWTR